MLLCYLILFTALYQTYGGRIPENIIKELYTKYEEAMANEKFKLFTRRIFRGNKQFEIHVEKLREVNGYKKHNLMVRESLKSGADPYIYINNPVESKIPKAYLTLEEFKDALTNRILIQRQEINKKQLKTKQYTKTIKNTEITIKNKTRIPSYIYRKATMKYKINKYIGITNKSNEIPTVINAFNIKNNIDTDNTIKIDTKKPEIEIVKLVPINNTNITNMMRNYTTEMTNASIEMDKINEVSRILNVTVSQKYTIRNETNTKINEKSRILNVTETEKYTIRNQTDAKINGTLFKEINTTVLNTSKILEKVTPRRKVTVKEISVTTAIMKRSTLGRPLVFLGN